MPVFKKKKKKVFVNSKEWAESYLNMLVVKSNQRAQICSEKNKLNLPAD